jgi:exonuclease VII large subunit
MGRGFTDETVVTIKFLAVDDMATYLRVKLEKSFRTIKVKGGIVQMVRHCIQHQFVGGPLTDEDDCKERVKCN